MTAELSVVPADEAGWDDLQAVLGARGMPGRCQCQRYRLARGESFAGFAEAERADRLRTQTDGGGVETTGLVGYLGDVPVGWVAVQPRPAYVGLVRVGQVPWKGRTEDRDDETVWAATCFVTRTGYRRRGVAGAMARAAVVRARDRGARALEGYPTTTAGALLVDLHVGTERVFAGAGLHVVSRPTPRRLVMRIDL